MTQENKEILLKDLCARLPYGLKCRVVKRSIDGEMLFIRDGLELTVDNVKDLVTNNMYEIKPYLFPLSSMTIEQEKELSKLGVSYGEYALHDDIRGLGIMVDEAYIFFEFCYKHHIDFLGLIEKGSALDATGLNIY